MSSFPYQKLADRDRIPSKSGSVSILTDFQNFISSSHSNIKILHLVKTESNYKNLVPDTGDKTWISFCPRVGGGVVV